jgi:tetratricopeptide (TPR) repeat protein
MTTKQDNVNNVLTDHQVNVFTEQLKSEHKEALKALNIVVKDYPNCYKTYILLSIAEDKASLETGDFEKGLFYLNKAKELGSKGVNHKNNIKAHYYTVGSYYFNKKEYEKSYKYYLKSAEGHSDYNFYYLRSVGNALTRLNKVDEARDYYKQSLKINNSYAKAHHSLGISYYFSEDYVDADKYFLLACEKEVNSPQYITDYANNLWKLEQYDKAIKQYYKIRMLQPNNVISYLLLSEALVAMRRYKELIKILSSIPDIVNQSTQLLNYLGTCHTEFGNSKEAKIFFDKANKLLSEGTKDDR